MAQASEGMIDGLKRRRLTGDGIEVDALVGGSGPPLLLLHGYPQTRMIWAGVVPMLLDRFTLVIPDLRGYGRSGKPESGGDHVAYSMRAKVDDQVATMDALGFARFFVAGHDRGGRVAYRLALDHPERVSRLSVMDIVPTSDSWNGMNAEQAVKMWHWTFLIQPDLPERLISSDPEFFVRWVLETQAGKGFSFDEGSVADYIDCLRDPAAVRGMCEDYRANWFVDRAVEEAERGRRKVTCPTLVFWAEQGALAKGDPIATWRGWADDVSGRSLPCGHFIPDEEPALVAEALAMFFGAASIG